MSAASSSRGDEPSPESGSRRVPARAVPLAAERRRPMPATASTRARRPEERRSTRDRDELDRRHREEDAFGEVGGRTLQQPALGEGADAAELPATRCVGLEVRGGQHGVVAPRLREVTATRGPSIITRIGTAVRVASSDRAACSDHRARQRGSRSNAAVLDAILAPGPGASATGTADRRRGATPGSCASCSVLHLLVEVLGHRLGLGLAHAVRAARRWRNTSMTAG